jgi:hypothetical protein
MSLYSRLLLSLSSHSHPFGLVIFPPFVFAQTESAGLGKRNALNVAKSGVSEALTCSIYTAINQALVRNFKSDTLYRS